MITQLRPLDIDTVQAFVLTADLGSFTRAAEALETSQSAISLKLKRLEDRLDRRLLERTPRKVRLTAAGSIFLAAARALLEAHARATASVEADAPRRLRLGVSDHVAGAGLATLIARLAAYDPALVLEVRISLSRDLRQEFERGAFDAILVRGEGEVRGGAAYDIEALGFDRLGWFAAPGWALPADAALPLASLAAPCGVRALAIEALDAAGVAWRETFIGGGVLAVGAAVIAGLGVAALCTRTAPPGAVEVGEALGLPPLPCSQIMLLARRTAGRDAAALRLIAAAYRTAG